MPHGIPRPVLLCILKTGLSPPRRSPVQSNWQAEESLPENSLSQLLEPILQTAQEGRPKWCKVKRIQGVLFIAVGGGGKSHRPCPLAHRIRKGPRWKLVGRGVSEGRGLFNTLFLTSLGGNFQQRGLRFKEKRHLRERVF